MTFTYTVNPKDSMGNGYVTGTYNSGAPSTSGSIITGLNNIKACEMSASSGSPNFPRIITTTTAGTMTVTGLASGQTGSWKAIGI